MTAATTIGDQRRSARPVVRDDRAEYYDLGDDREGKVPMECRLEYFSAICGNARVSSAKSRKERGEEHNLWLGGLWIIASLTTLGLFALRRRSSRAVAA